MKKFIEIGILVAVLGIIITTLSCIITMPKGPITIDPQIPETIEIDVNDL